MTTRRREGREADSSAVLHLSPVIRPHPCQLLWQLSTTLTDPRFLIIVRREIIAAETFFPLMIAFEQKEGNSFPRQTANAARAFIKCLPRWKYHSSLKNNRGCNRMRPREVDRHLSNLHITFVLQDAACAVVVVVLHPDQAGGRGLAQRSRAASFDRSETHCPERRQ